MDVFDICQVVQGELIGEPKKIEGFCINSKQVKSGQVFVAIKGMRHDGHDFIHEAFQRGAVGFIVEKDVDLPKGTFAIKVENTLQALRNLAKWKRDRFIGKVIAIAGSAGKTTTKEMVAFLLSKVARVSKTPKNFNSQITVPLSICNFPLDRDFWIVELGASQKGDVKNLVQVVKPNVRAITAIGEEHLETFGCLDDVILGNGEILLDIQKEDVAVYPQYVAHCYNCERSITFGEGTSFYAKDIRIDDRGVRFSVNNTKVYIPIPSLAVVENALCSFAILQALGIEWESLAEYLKDFQPMDGRFNVKYINGITIIDDSYNANPVSMKKALESLSHFNGTKVAVLGDMLELGKDSENYHRQLGEVCNDLPIDFFIFYGDHMRHAYQALKCRNKRAMFYDNKEDLTAHLKEILTKVQSPVVLFKGSRGMKMEEIIEKLTEEV